MPSTLERRDGVELARTGTWSLSSGTWDAAPGDFASAVAATSCPAVRRPYLRVGHTDVRFADRVPLTNPEGLGDGEPAIGWIENLRLADGGHTLVGDYVGVPSWLNDVMATAYPDRSIEGAYNRRCALNHVHPFVLDGLALLGVTRPGVGTLKSIGSLDDVRSLFAPVAASSDEVRIAASIPGAAIRARYHADQRRDGDGQWSDGSPTTSSNDRLGLGGRITPGDGEGLVSSDRLAPSAKYDADVLVAVVDGPDGREARIGVVGADDDGGYGTWDGTGDTTARLSAAEIDQLHDELTDAQAKAADAARRVDAEWAAGDTPAEYLDRPVAEGSVGGDAGTIHYSVWLTDDDPTSWTTTLNGSSGTEAHPTDDGSVLKPKDLRKLLKLLGGLDMAGSAPASVSASAEVHTGAMIALLPSDADAQRLAVDGGEPVEELHCTLFYLGDAAELPTKTRALLVERVAQAVAGFPPVEAEGFSVNAFNPNGDEPCIVLGASGRLLDDVHSVVAMAVTDLQVMYSLDLPENHKPWIPHVTLQYTGDASRVAALTDRTGPITFDRVRVVFGGEATDIPLTAVDWGALPIAAAAGKDELHRFWTKDPKGLAKWADKPHPWTSLYRELKKHMPDEMAKRVASDWYREVKGHTPNQKTTKASGGRMPNPTPSLADRVKAAWNASGAPFHQYVVRVDASAVVICDETDRSFQRVPVTVDGDRVTFGTPTRVMPDYVDYDAGRIAASVVFASRDESRPADPEVTPTNLPAAEPEPTTEPKEGDHMSTLSTDVRSRLGLPADATDEAVLVAFDELKTKADTPTAAQSDPALVAASAARDTENAELKKEVAVLASRVETVSTELAASKAKEAAVVKASVFTAARKNGKFLLADEEQLSKDYDENPGVITRMFERTAPGTFIPVTASGETGAPEPPGGTSSFERDYEAVFGPEKASA